VVPQAKNGSRDISTLIATICTSKNFSDLVIRSKREKMFLPFYQLLIFLGLYCQQPVPDTNMPFTIGQSKTSLNLSKVQVDHLNLSLQNLSPEEIIQWSIITFPHLYQTTAFGLTGLCITDMVHKITAKRGKKHAIDLIFIDTLHHFPQTLDLVERVKDKYHCNVHVFKPQNATTELEFGAQYGENLWETDDNKYDYLVKVEPSQRAYHALDVCAVFTGRRRSQGGKRGELPVIEIDEISQVVKINPLASWGFEQVQNYIQANSVPYNELLDLGYKSVGDYHSTQPTKNGEDERAGRWRGKQKSECGIHEASRFAQYLKAQQNI